MGTLGGVRRRVARWLEANEVPAGARDAALLVVSELVTNAIEASPTPDARVRLQLSRTSSGCRITVADHGPGFARVPLGGLQPDGGRGLHVVRRVARELTMRRERNGRTVVSAVVAGSDEPVDAITPRGSAPSGR
jgi:anti-sigma regulatory factor (Ser/Thr protein kinase)